MEMKREVLNRLLLMRLIYLSKGVKGRTRLQKLVFETETKIRSLGSTDTFNYKFIRWHYGPYSNEIMEDIEFLLKKELIKQTDNIYKISPKGKEYLEKTWKIVRQFTYDEKIMVGIITSRNTEKLEKLLEEVYDKYNIRNYKMGEVIEDLKYIGQA